jgi:non-ribosomal peptide synthetase component F
VPFERLVEELGGSAAAGPGALFQVLLAFEERPLAPALPGLEVRLLDHPPAVAHYDLSFIATDRGSDLELRLESRDDLFAPATGRRTLGHLRALLAAAAADPRRRLSELPLLSPGERAQLVDGWNDTAGGAPGDEPVQALVRRAAEQRGES